MSYAEYTLIADMSATGSLQVNCYQFYSAVATQLAAHPAWELVDTVNYEVTVQGWRSIVWRCKAAVSGLPNDFYVVFYLKYRTTDGWWYGTAQPFYMVLAEQYDPATKILSKYAPMGSGASQTLNADATNQGSWALNAAPPTTNPYQPNQVGLTTSASDTTYRLAVLVANDAIVLYGLNHVNGTSTASGQVYAGALESLLGSDLDPMPLILATSYNANATANMGGSFGHYSSTRHPGFGGQTGLGFLQFGPGNFDPTSTSTAWGLGYGPLSKNIVGNTNSPVLGDPAETGGSYWLGGVQVTRACVCTEGVNSTRSTHGGVRGFFKYIRVVALPTSASWGDKFYIDGKLFLTTGNGQLDGLLDTTQ